MSRVDERTSNYYETHARQLGESYASIESPLRPYFAMTFAPKVRVLDVGAGIGRDLAELVKEGFEAYGLEPSAALRDLAVQRFPQVGDRLRSGSMPDEMPPVAEFGGPFGGVLCSAVLQHVPRNKLFDSVFALKSLLADRGRVLVSVPLDHRELGDGRDEYGRLQNGVTADELELLFERAGFLSIGRWTENDALDRAGFRWTILALELRFSGEARPIDCIEAVLSNREKKVATYKLALIRALCAIALTEFRRATFASMGMVRVPIDAIAERWIDYYWPIFESPVFLPQMNGEMIAHHHLLSFATQLDDLIHAYRQLGGLPAFAADRRSGQVAERARPLHAQLLVKLRQAIRSGPVTYAKGAGSSPMFGYESGNVLVPAQIWRELSLMGHWIQDALVLRWADLVTRLSSGEVPADVVIARLITPASPARENAEMRDFYLQQPSLECVWTGCALDASTLAVDHLIPYSLWQNNDLWNLLPAHRRVNGTKSDLLPSRELLRSRREPILHCWSASSNAYPKRFSIEARAQTGREQQDLCALFDALLESVESTALQRAWPRWETSDRRSSRGRRTGSR